MNGFWKPGVVAFPTAAGRMASICPDAVLLTVVGTAGRTVAVKFPVLAAKRTTPPAQFTSAAGKFQAAAEMPFSQSSSPSTPQLKNKS